MPTGYFRPSVRIYQHSRAALNDLTAPKFGTVYWITGLSGAGKTTIGYAFTDYLRARGHPVVFLDGDILREVFGDDLGYNSEDRFRSAGRNCRLCRMIASQNVDVVCATISMFKHWRDWNRQNIPAYREIFLSAPIGVLTSRDHKGIYAKALAGQLTNVMGVDLDVEYPENPDLHIENDGSKSVADIIMLIAQLIPTSNER